MNKQKTKIIATTIVLVLMLGAFSAALAPSANAATPTQTYAFIAANPNPVGVGQPVQVGFWLADPPPTAAGATGDRWIGFTVTITKPDGTTETKGPYTSDAVGGAYFTYYPTNIGTYQFKMKYPGGQTMTGFTFFTGAFDNLYLASESATVSLTVQADPITNPPAAPLPTSYWTRPISGENLEWTKISSNWLMAAWNSTSRGFDAGFAVTTEGTMPETSHILWTKALTFGGLVGGIYGPAFFHDGRSYEYFFKPPVIISGRLYYNSIGAEEPRTIGNTNQNGIVCVDMETGETLFTIANESLSFGQIYNYVSPNQAGAHAYLWSTVGSNYKMFDAWTGSYILTIANVTGGVSTFGSDGSIMNYNIAFNATAKTNYITCWNSSKAIPPPPGGGSSDWQWRPYTWAGQTLDGNRGIQYSVPTLNVTGESLAATFGQSGMFQGGNIISMANGVNIQAYSMKDGSFQWNSTLQPPTNIPAKESLTGIAAFLNTFALDGTYYSFVKGTLQWVAYDMRTGQVKWITEPYTNAWSMYGTSVAISYGKFYAGGYGGDLNCYDSSNGKLLWTYSPGSAGFQTPYGFWPIYSGLTIADGKVIFTTSEHGNGVEPLYTGEKIYVVDAYTGENVWNVTGWFEQCAIADGKLLSHNCYDNLVYAFGKGPSATTVESALAGVTVGSNVVIQGTVTDQSVGAKGTPAIADEDMSEWMPYLYMQQALTTDVKGVPVMLTAIDPNGNSVDIATVTSDMAGNYAFMWTPTMEGMYTIGATFAGSGAYYGSFAETHIAVSKAAAVITPTTTPTVEPTVAPTATATASPSPVPNTGAGLGTEVYIAIAAAAVIAVVAAAALVLRKRK